MQEIDANNSVTVKTFGRISLCGDRKLEESEGYNYFFVIIAPACSRVRYRRPIFCPSVHPSVHTSVRLSTFMSTFDIYVKVSILINYKTKQPSNFA